MGKKRVVQFRQGDVFLEEVASLPEGERKYVPRENGLLILSRGEVTGHSHSIADKHAELCFVGADMFLLAAEPVCLMHQEHAPVEIGPRSYRVAIQREYSPEEIRNVAD